MSIVKESNYVCAYCGLAGYKKPSYLKQSKNHFCNRVCHSKWEYRKIEVVCDFDGCENTTLKNLSDIKRRKNNFCSIVCAVKFKDRKVEVECLHCHNKFMKKLNQIRKTSKHFCSEVCAKNLQKHKDWGGKRSKLEIAIEEHFKIIFPFMYIRYNKTDIGYELDIYIPCLELAIELNGVFHYRVIHKRNGVERLKRTQEIDAEKVVKCKELDIKLFVIDVSRDRGEKIKAQRILEVKGIVLDRINELGYVFKNEQMVMNL
jgi:hypothetical protein